MPEIADSGAIDVLFLRDTRHGGAADQAATVARRLAAFIGGAKASVDLAIYDFRLSAPLADPVVSALVEAAGRGVAVRIAYDAGKPAEADAAAFARLQADPAPPGIASWVRDHFAGTPVAIKAIAAPSGQLMHSKYVVRDVRQPDCEVWTGSANFTDDAWSLQENNILTIRSASLGIGYRADFDQLWTAGTIKNTGGGDAGTTTVNRVPVGWDFAPADGPGIDSYLTQKVAAATRRVILSTMVLTSHSLLAALTQAIGRGVPVSGNYDAGQMDSIARQWARYPSDTEVLADWKTIAAHLTGKHSVPYSPTSPHDFMHNKILITDDDLATGSYNLSANARHNAENQLHIRDRDLADRYATYIATINDAYPRG